MRNINTQMFFTLFISYILTSKIYIESYSDTTKALTLTKLNNGQKVFNFQSIRRKEMQGIYCLSPIIVPISNTEYRFYYCGDLMCLKNGKLTVCDKISNESSFNIKKTDNYHTIRKNNKCLHVYQGKIFLRGCDDKSDEQKFILDHVRVPTGDNIDIEYDKREHYGGRKDIEFDNVMRQLSKIHRSEFIEDLFESRNKEFSLLKSSQ
ncbi:ricin B lectin (RBL7) [Vairimorpha necatrix]|uniref:Ricin B lectin (RBL7) n=1 Tax=Vairimorpha necatrix TaxID=6039 RepID=A0AAX4JEK8_9MICR